MWFTDAYLTDRMYKFDVSNSLFYFVITFFIFYYICIIQRKWNETSQLTYTAEVNWKMLTRAEFELAPSGYRSAALPVELWSQHFSVDFSSVG